MTVEVASAGGAAQARALLPALVVDTPREVSRLQISGTELPADLPPPPPDGVPVIWLNPAVELTVGKAAAQVGHATMLLAAALPDEALERWRAGGLGCAVRPASPERWTRLRAAGLLEGGRVTVLVRDAGFTEIAPGTVTCAARWSS
jgi:peptidyl-tRNA hydrolase